VIRVEIEVSYLLTYFMLSGVSAQSVADIIVKNYHIFGSVGIMSWKDMRDAKLEKQDEDFSCGSASVATILRSFYGLDVYEKDILTQIAS